MKTIIKSKHGGKHIVEYDFAGNDTVRYYVGYKEGTAKINYCSWVRGLHGNAPAGTKYGSFRVTLPDGSRKNVPIYV